MDGRFLGSLRCAVVLSIDSSHLRQRRKAQKALLGPPYRCSVMEIEWRRAKIIDASERVVAPREVTWRSEGRETSRLVP